MKSLALWCVGLACLVGLLGCAGEEHFSAVGEQTEIAGEPPEGGGAFDDAAINGAPGGEGQPAKADADEPLKRRIIFTGHLTVHVTEFDDARKKLLDFVDARDGYIAQSEITGQTGERRTGTWTVRIPVDHFQELIDSTSALGEQESYRKESEDITLKYVDLEARIKNAEAHEASLKKLQQESVGKVSDLRELQVEISKAREEIERMEAQRRAWAQLSSLATAHVTLQEVKDYQPYEPPTFGEQAGTTFEESTSALAKFGKGLVLFFVGLAPWLPVILAVVGLCWWLVRRGLRKASAATVTEV